MTNGCTTLRQWRTGQGSRRKATAHPKPAAGDREVFLDPRIPVSEREPSRASAPLWRRMVRPVVMVAVLVFVFGWLLPQFIGYDEVWDALAELDTTELLVLLGLALARVPTEALMYRAFLSGLRMWRGSEAYLSSNFVGQILPPPRASLVPYAYFRGENYPSDTAGLAAAGSFLFPTLGRFLLPVVAVVVLLVTGEVDGTIAVAGGVALLITAAAALASYVLLRSEGSARWLGARLQGPSTEVGRCSGASRSPGWQRRPALCAARRWSSSARAGSWGRSVSRPTSCSPF